MVPQSRPPILVTRPQPQASRFGRQLRALDWTGRVSVSPVLEPHFARPLLPDVRFCAIILTSETAVRAAADLPGLPRTAFCVGDRTAQAARRAGFTAISAEGDSGDLLERILAAGLSGPLLYLHGRDTRGQLADRLNSACIETYAALAYAQEPRPLGPAALRLLRQPGPLLLPIFSPRTATLLAAQWQSAGAGATAYVVALSPAVAKAAAALHPARMAVAAHPDGDSLLAAMRPMAEDLAKT